MSWWFRERMSWVVRRSSEVGLEGVMLEGQVCRSEGDLEAGLAGVCGEFFWLAEKGDVLTSRDHFTF